jgi:hypothetical protein
MDNLESAQKLFTAYQSTSNIFQLKDALDILDELIDGNGGDAAKARNLKKAIKDSISKQISDFFQKYNVGPFLKKENIKDVKDDNELTEKLVRVVGASFSRDDLEILVELLTIQSDYYSAPS